MSKSIAVLIGFVCATVVIMGTAGGLAVYFHRDAIDAIYKNVDDIVDGEMPPTVTSFQSGPDVVSTIGGSGEGLNCSLPGWVDRFFDNFENEEGNEDKRLLVRQRFRQACVFHDLCYRHGLATYGYNQNDCDRALQNQAFRLCLYIRSDATKSGTRPSGGAGRDDGSIARQNAERCQTDSKMILAGVSLGGSGAYRAWDRSTYFEFESDPARSNGFSVGRVVDHPFKSADPPGSTELAQKYHAESDQIILTFENVRSNLTVTCITCAELPVFEWTPDPNKVSAELRSVGFNSLPEALLTHAALLPTTTNPIWLPPRRRHAAPHLLVDSKGKNHLIWMSRNNRENSMSCVVLADAARLLTHTLPRLDLCAAGVRSRLTMVEVDMFASSPLPMETPGAPEPYHIVATGLSVQKKADRSLSFCSRSASRAVTSAIGDDQAPCLAFDQKEVLAGAGLGAFQNFAVVRPGQQIFFARDVRLPSTSLLENTYSPTGNVLVVDVGTPTPPAVPVAAKIQKVIPFTIPDQLDPMMPITRKTDDLRFLSLQASGETERVGVRMIDFSKDKPADEEVSLTMNGSKIELHRSWALRPVLVLETKEAKPKTRLVFSRGEIAGEQGKPANPAMGTEAMSLEMLVFELDATAAPNVAFAKTRGANCTITYTFETRDDYSCYRTFDRKRTMRSSPAAKMQASQLLVGNFAGRGGHGIAFPDACLKGEPIVLRPKAESASEFQLVSKNPAGATNLNRKVTCYPIDSNAALGEKIKHRPDGT